VVFVVILGVLTAVSGSGFFLGVYAVGAVVTALALIGVWLFKPFPARVSEWKFSVDGKAAAEKSAFEHITWSFQRRETPVQSVGVRRITQSGVSRDYLEVRSGIFFGYVSCFAYGNDLFISWTFWMNFSPVRYFLMWLRRLWHLFTMRGSELYVTLSYEPMRAMREAIHSACREGIDVAAGEVQPQGAGIVGTSVGIDLTDLTSID
jgi:hypothetical protein